MDGRQAKLITPWRGYRNITLVEYHPNLCQWEVEICGSGKRLFLYEDEFVID